MINKDLYFSFGLSLRGFIINLIEHYTIRLNWKKDGQCK